MAIVKQYHKDTDTTYVYESESYWDPELKQSRSQRKCIGKIDPNTGEIIPTGKRGRKNDKQDEKADNEAYTKLLIAYQNTQQENVTLSAKVNVLEKELSDTVKQLRKYQTTVGKIKELSEKL
jgi:hypothetical protein